MKIRASAALVFATLWCAGAGAQPHVRVAEVLTATSDVHDMAVVGDRVLLATSGGLVVRRGDQVERILSSRDGLRGVRLRSVSVVTDGVWLGGVEGAALVRVDDAGVSRPVRHLALRRVQRVVRFGGATWLGTWGDGIFRLEDGEGARPRRVPLGRHQALSRITDLRVHGEELWVATAGAGIAIIADDGSVTRTLRQGLADPFVWRLETDGDRIVAATAAGVTVIGPEGIVPDAPPTALSRRLPVTDVRAVLRTGDTWWLATWGAGLWHAESTASAPTRVGPERAARVRSLAAVRDAVVVGHDAGLGRARVGDTELAVLDTGGLPSSDITSLAEAFGALWVGTFSQGLARVRAGRAEAVAQATSRWGLDGRINDLAVTRDHRGQQTLWIATDRGLWWHDGRRFTPVEERGTPGRVHVTSLHVDRTDGSLWVTSSRSLCRHASRWQCWSGDSRLPIVNLHAVTTDGRGRVWVGSLHGLYRFDRATGRFERHTVSSGALPVDWVTALEPWGNGVVAGTYHGGLSWYDDSAFHIEREERGGLPAGWVNPHAMRWVGSRLWIGTQERGLLVGWRGEWTRLRTSDGLPSDDVTAVLPVADGRVWVATRGGLARVETGR